jgi:hypothetical protein
MSRCAFGAQDVFTLSKHVQSRLSRGLEDRYDCLYHLKICIGLAIMMAEISGMTRPQKPRPTPRQSRLRPRLPRSIGPLRRLSAGDLGTHIDSRYEVVRFGGVHWLHSREENLSMRLPDDHRDWLTPDGSGGFIYDPPLEPNESGFLEALAEALSLEEVRRGV